MIQSNNKIYFYINDKKSGGNTDLFKQIKLFKSKYKNIFISDKLRLDCHKMVIQENFLNPLFCIKFLIFFIFFKGKIYLLLSEFVTKRKNIITFNNFDNSNISNNIIINLIKYIYFKALQKIKGSNKYDDKIFIYHHKLRFFTTKLFIKFFDGFILTHSKINFPDKNFKRKLKFQFPYFFKKIKINKKIINKKILLKFSGKLTKYRIQKLSKLSFNCKNFENLQISKILSNNNYNFIKLNKDKNNLIFALHIEKKSCWEFSSPTRYLNSIEKNHIPIIFKDFKDEYSQICLDKKILFETSKKKIFKKISNLNKNIQKINTKSKRQLKNLINF